MLGAIVIHALAEIGRGNLDNGEEEEEGKQPGDGEPAPKDPPAADASPAERRQNTLKKPSTYPGVGVPSRSISIETKTTYRLPTSTFLLATT